MKLQLIALAAAALFVGQAEAASPAALNQYTYYVSGSSALTPVIKAIFQTNSTTPSVAPATFQNAASGANQFIFQATVKASSTLGTKLGLSADTLVTVFKRDSGGSIYGVNPLISGPGKTPVNVTFLSETSTFNASNVATTVVNKSHVPELGAADVEPAVLNTAQNLARDASGNPVFAAITDFTGLTTKTALLQTFAIAANKNLYDALVAAQSPADGVPSVSISQVRSLVNNGLNSAAKSWGYLLNNGDLSQINIGRRAAGSGTQATANILFSGSGSLGADTPLGAGDSDAGGAVGSGGILFVKEGGSTGDVKTFLNDADKVDTATFAIGYIGYENKPDTTNADLTKRDTWKFVKLDGYTADIANTQNGTYQWAFESTFNYNTAYYNANANQVKGFIDAIVAETANPAVIANLTPALQTAVTPVATSLATRGGNSYSALKITK